MNILGGNKIRGVPSFTLIELLVAVSVFSIIIVAAASSYVSFQNAKRRADLISYIKSEGDFLMQRMKKEIQNSTVDYEEYYNQLTENSDNYADNYGKYGQRFFDAGVCGTFTTKYGVQCFEDCSKDYWTVASCTEIEYSSKDFNMWAWDSDNALKNNNFQNELYLINGRGDEKTILKNFEKDYDGDGKDEFKLHILKLKGEDGNSNGIIDSWFCADDFLLMQGKDTANVTDKNTCAAYSLSYVKKGEAFPLPSPNPDAIKNNAKGYFVSWTPEKLKITNLGFFISPLEDPRKGKGENLAGDTYVTISLTVQPLEKYTQGIAGGIPEYTMQTTVNAGAKNFIRSWHGVMGN